MSPTDFSKVLAIVVVVAISVFVWPPKNRAFRRRGIEPGFLDVKVWPARVWFFFKGHDIVHDAYREAKDSPYWLQTLISDVLVLPPKYLSELRMLPGSKLNASEALVDSVMGQHNGVDVILKDRQAYDLARVQLTQSLPAIIPMLSQKVDEILSEKLAMCTASTYTSVKAQDFFADIVLRTTLLAFVGPKLSEDSELHEIVKSHPNLVRDIAIFLMLVPERMRQFVSPFLPPTKRMKHLHERARQILFSKTLAGSNEGFKTMLQHFVETSEVINEQEIVSKFFVLIGGALHTMTMSTVHAVIDLCAYPEYVSELRDEISYHIPAAKSMWQADQISRLKVLDSFLKESQRFNPPNYLSFDRMTMAPISLHDGTVVPKRTYICMAAGSMAMDPEFYKDPETFLPSRFHTVDSGTDTLPDKARRNLDFVGTESGNIHWGGGRFTCPGRWYASAMMKVIMAQILTNYDVRFPDGQTKRRPNVYMDIMVEPDPEQTVLFRLRR